MSFLSLLWEWTRRSGFGEDALYLMLAAFLASLIGAQRELTGRSAGLRTHILVGMAACMLTRVRLDAGDPGRIVAQIVSGIGFLGAGVIWRRGSAVRGLTTAATVWMVAGIGIATGAGGRYAALAAFSTLVALFTLVVGLKVENRIRRSEQFATLNITVGKHKGAVTQILAAITDAGASVTAFESYQTMNDQRGLTVTVRFLAPVTRHDIDEALILVLPDGQFSWEV